MTELNEEEKLKATLESLSDLAMRSAKTVEGERRQLLESATPLISQLKAINRSIYTTLNARKAEVNEARRLVDIERLKLQNYEYEKTMLKLEVWACRMFQSIYQDVELHSEQEFLQLAPPEMKTEEIVNDPHLFMLSRLRFELLERKRLEVEKQSLQSEKSAVLRQNKDKKRRLEEAEKDLKALLEATKALQGKFAGPSSQPAQPPAAAASAASPSPSSTS
ncbi:hypothetical protein ACQY0O_001651 [Thecaphora frezii]